MSTRTHTQAGSMVSPGVAGSWFCLVDFDTGWDLKRGMC